MGYTAERAGMMISPGGVAIMLLMPLIGFLVTHYDARKLIAFGFLIIGVATLRMMRFNLDVDFRTMMWARVLQASAFRASRSCSFPFNTAAYAYLPREKSKCGFRLINLSRNIEYASVGISFVTTMLARRTQYHQSVLITQLSNYNEHFLEHGKGLDPSFRRLRKCGRVDSYAPGVRRDRSE